MFDLAAQINNLGFEAFQALCDGLKGEFGLPALLADSLELLACTIGLSGQTLILSVQTRQRSFCLGDFIAGAIGALHGVHGIATALLGLRFGVQDAAHGIVGALLLRLRGGLVRVRLCGGRLQKSAVLFAFAGEMGEGFAGLGKLVICGCETLGQLRLAVDVGVPARLGALEIDGGGAGACGGVTDLTVELVAARGAGAVLGVQRFEFGGLRVDQTAEPIQFGFE